MMKRSAAASSPDRKHVALLIETSLASGRDILRGIARFVREHQPWALYHEAHGFEAAVPQWLRRWRGDGIIARIQSPKMAAAIEATGIPTVDVLGLVPNRVFPLVRADDALIANVAAAHFIERGLREFGFFGIEGENWSDRRYAGFRASITSQLGLAKATNIARYDSPRHHGRRSWESIENTLALWITSLPKPVGVFVCSDQRGSQFLEACRRAGVRVPDDMAVIGVDNDEPLCEVCNPSLSSIEAGHTRVGYEAAALLDRLMNGGRAAPQRLLIEPQGAMLRQSSDMLAIGDTAIATALRLIREHAHEELRVDSIAHEAGLSRSVLQRRFRSELKRSVHAEILANKIKRARELLIHTDLPLAAVAERSGFKHQEYMGAVLKKHLNQTPAGLRLRLQSRQGSAAKAGRRGV